MCRINTIDKIHYEEKTLAQFISTNGRGPTCTDCFFFNAVTSAAAVNTRRRSAWFLFLVFASTKPGKHESTQTKNDRVEISDATALCKRATADPPHGRGHIYLRTGLGHGLGKELHGQHTADQKQQRHGNSDAAFG